MTDPLAPQRQALRDLLTAELKSAAMVKDPNKPIAAIQKRSSCKQKFLQNPNMRPHKGDVPDYMPAIKSDSTKRREK